MPLSLRTLSVVLLAGFLFAILLTQGSAEPPVSEPPASEPIDELREGVSGEALLPSEFPIPEPTPLGDAQQERIKKVIEDAINGKLGPGGTGDPILDGILGGLNETKPLSQQLGEDLFPEADVTSRIRQTKPGKGNATAAEAILRAARLLEAVDNSSPERDELITEMRAEAKRLL